MTQPTHTHELREARRFLRAATRQARSLGGLDAADTRAVLDTLLAATMNLNTHLLEAEAAEGKAGQARSPECAP